MNILDPVNLTSPSKTVTPSSGQLEPDLQTDWQAWRKQDSAVTRGSLLKKIKPILDTAVYSYAGAKASPHIHSEAKLLAMDAFHTYDPYKGTMRTHLLSQLQRLQRINARDNQIISMPERVALTRSHLREAEENLRDRLGRDPSDADIADYTGMSLKRIGYIREAKPPVNSGSIIDETGEVYAPAATMPGGQNKADAWQTMIYYDLGKTDRAIMDYTLGLRGAPQLSNQALASRLGLSPGAISQRKAKIQKLLDSQYQNTLFGEAY